MNSPAPASTAPLEHAPAIEVDRVSVNYGQKAAVQEASLRVLPGEIHVLLGESGSGKTTLLRALAGLERLSAGCIVLQGRIVEAAQRPDSWTPPESRAIGFVFQDYALFPHLSVAENVMFGQPGHRAAARTVLEQVGLGDYANSWPSELSGGQQQRVALARALATKPQVLLLDEPFSGVDKRLRRGLRAETATLLRKANVAAVWVTHDVEEAFVVGDRLSVMADGRVLQTGTPEQLYREPADATVALTIGDGSLLQAEHSEAGGARCALGPLELRGFGRTAPHGFRREGRVVVRPEQVRLAPSATAPKHAVPVRVAQVTYLGAHVELSLVTGDGTQCDARLPSTHPLAVLPLVNDEQAELSAWIEGKVPWIGE